MFIIPIGTKAELALKPKITIGLIAVNVIIAVITIPLMMNTQGKLFNLQKKRISKQIKLYILDHREELPNNRYIERELDQRIEEVALAKSYDQLNCRLYAILTFMGIDYDQLEQYGTELGERTNSYYKNGFSESSWLFQDWKKLKAQEDKVINQNVNHTFGLVPEKMHRIHTLITYQFLHGGIWHLIGNMIFLWVVGCLLEDSWGRGNFLSFYLMGGAFAGLVHCFQDTSSVQPLIGASGSIAAAMGAFTVRHFWTKIKFFYFILFFFRPYWGTFHLPAFIFLPFWFLQQLTYKYISDQVGGTSVAYMAHIGGYIAGLCTALTMRATGFEERFIVPRINNKRIKAGVLKDPRFNRACEEMQRGNKERARMLLSQLIRENPEDLQLLQDTTILYQENGLEDECTELSNRILKRLLIDSKYNEAAQLITEAIHQEKEAAINPQYMMRTASWLVKNENYSQAHDIYRSIIHSNANSQITIKASISLAKLQAHELNDPHGASTTLEEAARLNIDPEWTNRLLETRNQIEKTLEPADSMIDR
jgi:membrane associated rhomboid family serine protease